MSLLIGMDEAGLGPNFGPFVVAATVWEVPGAPGDFDFWTAFDTVLTRAPGSCDPRLHVADSKQVFQPGRGIASLERGVTSALQLCGVKASTFRELCEVLSCPLAPRPGGERGRVRDLLGDRKEKVARHSNPLPAEPGRGDGKRNGPPRSHGRSLFDDAELSAARSPTDTARTSDDDEPLPWYEGDGLALPVESADVALVEPWQRVCERLGVKLLAIRADVVEPLRFNRLVRRYDNKSQATSRLAMNLLSRVWQPDDDEALIVADKHGGRNRYDTLLTETFEQPVQCLTEGAEQSIYHLGRGELCFQPRAESHGPVALASMTAKYLRELAMHQFNRFWQARIPDLKPTQGYPVDAKRYREQIAAEQRHLNIPDDSLWRER
jgi:ribonuclease HII